MGFGFRSVNLFIEDDDELSAEEEDAIDIVDGGDTVRGGFVRANLDEEPESHAIDEVDSGEPAQRMDEANQSLIKDKEIKNIVMETGIREKQIFTGKGEKFMYPIEWDSDEGCGSVRLKLHLFMDALPMRILAMILVILDITLVLVSIFTKGHPAYRWISLAIVIYFVIELILRIFAWGASFFKDKLEVLDGFVIIITFGVSVMIEVIKHEKMVKYASLVIIFRFVRFALYLRIFFNVYEGIVTALRYKATQSKKRYVQDGFDLDLTYITPRVIAMSFPSSGAGEIKTFPPTKVDMELAIRNDKHEVAKFFDEKHADHYKIYNLCKERGYNIDLFHGRVKRYLIEDHNVPTLSELLDFCVNADEYLKEDADNVIAVHCKGGKGRTGCCIASYLMYSGIIKTANKSLEFFGGRRMDTAKGVKYQGVETPSQKRYCVYLETVIRKMGGKMPPEREITIKSIEVRGLEDKAYLDLYMDIVKDGVEVAKKIIIKKEKSKKKYAIKTFDAQEVIKVAGDVKFRFTSSALGKDYDNCSFFFWMHTSFHLDNKFEAKRGWIGNANKPKHHDKYTKDFSVKLVFTDDAAMKNTTKGTRRWKRTSKSSNKSVNVDEAFTVIEMAPPQSAATM